MASRAEADARLEREAAGAAVSPRKDPQYVWSVTVESMCRPGEVVQKKSVLARDILQAAQVAERLINPINDGKGHVYDMRAVSAKLITRVEA